MTIEATRVDIDGDTYQLRLWSTKDGQRWAFRLARIAASSLGSTSSLLAAVDEETFFALVERVEHYTDLIGTDDSGHETVRPLAKLSAVHLRGKHGTTAALVRAHVEKEFAHFFTELGGILRAAFGKDT